MNKGKKMTDVQIVLKMTQLVENNMEEKPKKEWFELLSLYLSSVGKQLKRLQDLEEYDKRTQKCIAMLEYWSKQW